jgi:hypothetical protein
MKTANFGRWRTLFDEECAAILRVKGNDYASGDDRLANFKRLAARLGLSPIQVWAVYFVKPIDAILEYAKAGKVSSEPIRGRFAVARNYLDLGLALIEEEAGLVQEGEAPHA